MGFIELSGSGVRGCVGVWDHLYFRGECVMEGTILEVKRIEHIEWGKIAIERSYIALDGKSVSVPELDESVS